MVPSNKWKETLQNLDENLNSSIERYYVGAVPSLLIFSNTVPFLEVDNKYINNFIYFRTVAHSAVFIYKELSTYKITKNLIQ